METIRILTLASSAEKKLEIIFLAVISPMVFVFFYAVLSANGLVLGNDPAFHLGRAEMILATGVVPMGDFMWYPPLYHLLLSSVIAFTGATSIDQLLFVMKTLTALMDWLLVAAVYLIGAKFFTKKYGILASALTMLCLPLFAVNSWGGYTTILAIALMCLMFVYLPTVTRSIQPVLITFILTFSIVLSQQLATFLALFILPPFVLVLLVTSRGKQTKALVVALLGGAIAFFLYYVQPILARFNMVIYHVFFGIQSMAYQIPSVNFGNFYLDFGFLLVFATVGSVLAFFSLRRQEKLNYFLILFLSLLIPLFFSQSYLVGLYLPFEMFTYYLVPPLAVFGAVAFSYVIDLFLTAKRRIKVGHKTLMKILAVAIVIIMSLVLLFRFQTVGDRINQNAAFFSISDTKAYDAATWLGQSYPDNTTVVVTQKPGLWFGMYSGIMVVAETDPVIERNPLAESVLDMSYEIEQPFTLVRALEAKDVISDELCVSIDSVWQRVSYLSEQQVFLAFTQNNVAYDLPLSSLDRNITFIETGFPKTLIIDYSNDNVRLTENLSVQNDSYPVDVTWQLTPLSGDISNASLYIATSFDAGMSFDKAYVPGVLDWQSPWDKPSYTAGNDDWVLVDLAPKNMTQDCLGFYDDNHQVAYAIKFTDLPESGNVGALANRMIDAVRFQYQLGDVTANQTALSRYQVLTFSKTSYSEMQLSQLEQMFDMKPASSFDVLARDYTDYIKQNSIGFVVYDKSSFDASLLRSSHLQQVYSNDEYIICKINIT
jgi:asparagine N-glycosylation enzyme membrane subunit Stt3